LQTVKPAFGPIQRNTLARRFLPCLPFKKPRTANPARRLNAPAGDGRCGKLETHWPGSGTDDNVRKDVKAKTEKITLDVGMAS
jgi:hypothetical protein